MDLQQWKDKIAKDTYNKSWLNLSRFEQESLTAKHRVQFYTLTHNNKNKKRGDRSIHTRTTHSKKGTTMNDIERDNMLIEMHTDIKWLKGYQVEHKATHAKYIYYFIVTAIGVVISMFR